MLKTCLHCSITFPKRADSAGIFCSKSCNAKYNNARRPKKVKPQLQCLHCSITIIPPNKFCGHSCAATYTNANRTYKPTKKLLESNLCPQCNIKFTGKNKFCSRQCGYDNKKKVITSEERLNLKRARNRESYRRYIARRKYQTPIGEDITAIRQFYINCPKGHEVDHIIPISKGGSHSLENLQYLTKEENRRKSNKIL